MSDFDRSFTPPPMVDLNSPAAAAALGLGSKLPLRAPNPGEHIALGQASTPQPEPAASTASAASALTEHQEEVEPSAPAPPIDPNSPGCSLLLLVTQIIAMVAPCVKVVPGTEDIMRASRRAVIWIEILQHLEQIRTALNQLTEL